MQGQTKKKQDAKRVWHWDVGKAQVELVNELSYGAIFPKSNFEKQPSGSHGPHHVVACHPGMLGAQSRVMVLHPQPGALVPDQGHIHTHHRAHTDPSPRPLHKRCTNRRHLPTVCMVLAWGCLMVADDSCSAVERPYLFTGGPEGRPEL